MNSTSASSSPVSENVPYGISEWPNTDDIYERLAALLRQPLRPIRREKMETVLRYFQDKCKTSLRISEEASRIIPGGVQHNLAFNYPFPLAINGTNGAYLTDVDGNRYIDFLKAGGPTLLASNDESVRQQVHKLLDSCGPVTGLLHEYEIKLAALVCQAMPSIEMFRMLGSGTEAVMAALRLARAYTGRKWVIKIGGAYHGWSDQMVYGMRLPGTGRREAIGIPRPSTAYIQERFPNDLEALRRTLWLNRLRGGTAAIIVEPLGPESGTWPVERDFNRQLETLCREFGSLLIFDEVVTGFRVGMGGAQGYFGVQPDITVLESVSLVVTPWLAELGKARRDDVIGRGDWHDLKARLRWRNAVCQPALLCCRLFRDSRDAAYKCLGQGRPRGRPVAAGTGRNHRPPRFALRRLQHGFRSPLADLRRHADEHAESNQGHEASWTSQAHDGGDGCRFQRTWNHNHRGQPHLHRACRY